MQGSKHSSKPSILKTIYLFYELIQVNLCVRQKLSHTPSAKEWAELSALSQKQAVAGVTFLALEKLSKEGQKPPLPILYEWIALSEQIKQQNEWVNRNAVGLCKILNDDGFECCILKGQGNNLMYPNPWARMPGDIDVWLRNGKSKKKEVRDIIEYVKRRNPKGIACYHHIDYGLFNGTEVEVHYRPSFMFNPTHNSRLQKWFCAHASEQFQNKAVLPGDAGEVCVPTACFNVIFQLSHMYNHLLHEGLGFRQILDYYYVLKSNTNRMDNANICNTLRYLRLEKIAGAMMWVLHEKLGLPEEYLIAPMDERRGRVLLGEIIKGGNFGHYDEDNVKANSRFKKNIQRVKRDIRMMRYFPSECLWEPVFRVYHYFWRRWRA